MNEHYDANRTGAIEAAKGTPASDVQPGRAERTRFLPMDAVEPVISAAQKDLLPERKSSLGKKKGRH